MLNQRSFVLLTFACAEVSPDPATDVREVPLADEALVEDLLDRAASTSAGGFVRATETPFPSTAAAGALIDEWVSEPAWDAFRSVRQHQTGSGVALPADALIVRTVLTAEGTVSKHTLLWSPLADPDVSELFFVAADADWNVIETDGVWQAGYLTSCQSCHAGRAEDGWLFGLPE